jgi:hypothetical protein
MATDLEEIPLGLASDRYGSRWEPGKHAVGTVGPDADRSAGGAQK